MGELTPGMLNTISILDRIGSAISLVGGLFIVLTYTCSSPFRVKPINRLVFYASFGNIVTSIATMMSRSFVDEPNSFGCQFQAMLIEWFMAADVGWILAMAINVYLTIYRQYDTRRLRRLEPVYLLVCYGIPFVPAFVYLFVRDNGKRLYGNAVLWCWLSNDFKVLRVASFYGPVWGCIILTIAIYIRAGRKIYRIHRKVRKYGTDSNLLSDASGQDRGTLRSMSGATIESNPGIHACPAHQRDKDSVSSPSVNSGHKAIPPVHLHEASNDEGTYHNTTIPSPSTAQSRAERRLSRQSNSAAWSYAKYALLYFVSILVTWVPSTADRAYSIAHDENSLPALLLMHAFVMPLQGFWNWVIYTIMSWNACKELFRRIKDRVRAKCKRET